MFNQEQPTDYQLGVDRDHEAYCDAMDMAEKPMSAKEQYKAAYRNQRMLRANSAHMATDRFDYPYYKGDCFVAVSNTMSEAANKSLIEGRVYKPEGKTTWYAKNGFMWQTMVKEYLKGAENWSRWQKYFKLGKVA